MGCTSVRRWFDCDAADEVADDAGIAEDVLRIFPDRRAVKHMLCYADCIKVVNYFSVMLRIHRRWYHHRSPASESQSQTNVR